MPDGPREHTTGIQINEEGEWSVDGAPIENPSILQFFKKNLHRDQRGFYIYNEFGALSEKAYIEVCGPLMRVLCFESGEFLLESGQRVRASEATIVMTPPPQERIYLKIPELGAWAIFARQAVIDFSEGLSRRENQYFWGETPLEVVTRPPSVLPWRK